MSDWMTDRQVLDHVTSASRRRFLKRASLLFLAAAVSRIAAAAPQDVAPLMNQSARINRALGPQTMAQCRKAAENLMPRIRSLLKTPNWETETVKAIVAELKFVGAFRIDRAPLDPKCAQEAERLRGDAEGTRATSNAVSAAITAASAVVSIAPPAGPIIAAILAMIAAVMILIGQLITKAKEDEAARKEKKAGLKELEAEREDTKRLDKLTSDFVAELELHPDCELAKKPCPKKPC
jgi:hypothetical protein